MKEGMKTNASLLDHLRQDSEKKGTGRKKKCKDVIAKTNCFDDLSKKFGTA